MALFEVIRPWQGRWREETIALPGGAIVVPHDATNEIKDYDIEGKRIFTFEADFVAYVERDAPGTLAEYTATKAKARSVDEKPPNNRQVTRRKTRSRKKKADKETTDDE